jgi:hypothetical protein
MRNPFYINLPYDKIRMVCFGFWIVCAYAIYTWITLQAPVNITADTLWLCEAAERLLAGEKMSQSYYDPNPPLSVLLYVPPVLIAKAGLLSLHYAIFWYTLAFLAGAVAATYRIMKSIPDMDETTIYAVLMALIVGNTVMTSMAFTERDQIIGMWLLPFMLAQIAITKGWPVPPVIKHITLLLGAVLILIKPHHGLIPTAIILHRFFTQRRLSFWKDADFLYLAGAVLAYAAIIAIFFQDFVQIILPDILTLYSASNVKFVLVKSAYYGMLCVAALLVAVVVGRTSWLVYFLLWAALFSIIPFLVQMRGYHYHILPALALFWCGAAVLGKEFFQRFMPSALALLLVTSAMTILAFMATPSRLFAPTYEQYKTLPLAEELKDCEAPCPVFVLNDHIEITHQTALYSDIPWASRFASFWFVPGVFYLEERNPEEFERLRHKYALMVAEDLERYKPKRVLLGEFKIRDDVTFTFMKLFRDEKEFKQAWSHYRHTGEFTMNQGRYFPRSKQFRDHKMTYQVFERVKD